MSWVVVGAWIFAALVAIVILGFCAFELASKSKRLQADLRGLQELNEHLAALQNGLAETQARVAAVRLTAGSGA